VPRLDSDAHELLMVQYSGVLSKSLHIQYYYSTVASLIYWVTAN